MELKNLKLCEYKIKIKWKPNKLLFTYFLPLDCLALWTPANFMLLTYAPVASPS